MHSYEKQIRVYGDNGNDPFRDQETTTMIQLDGVTITALGFTASQFDEAVRRAYDERLTAHDVQKRWTAVIHNPKKGMAYLVTPETCTCMVGPKGHPCSPRAVAVHTVDALGRDITRHGCPPIKRIPCVASPLVARAPCSGRRPLILWSTS